MDCGPPGFSVHGVSQGGILEWVTISFVRGSSQLRDRTLVSCIAGRFFTTEPPGKVYNMLFDTFTLIYYNMIAIVALVSTLAAAKSLQSCPTLCDPIDGSPPGSPVPGILQTRTLEWVAISFSNA